MKNLFPSLILSWLLIGCASTSTTMSSTYSKPDTNLSQSGVQKAVVYAMTSNEQTRRIIEDAYTQRMGASVVASYKYMDQPIERINHTVAKEKMLAEGYNSAIIVRLIDQQHTGSSRRTGVYVNPNLYYGFGGGWNAGIGINVTPGYNTKQDQYTIETSVYNLQGNNEDLLWSGTTLAANPDDLNTMAADVSSKVVSQMKADGLRF